MMTIRISLINRRKNEDNDFPTLKIDDFSVFKFHQQGEFIKGAFFDSDME